jgi:hypothetical protein
VTTKTPKCDGLYLSPTMKAWKFYAYLGGSFISIAGVLALYTLLAPNTYIFYAALVFVVMTIHASIYAEWKYLKHPTEEANLKSSKSPREPKPISGST